MDETGDRAVGEALPEERGEMTRGEERGEMTRGGEELPLPRKDGFLLKLVRETLGVTRPVVGLFKSVSEKERGSVSKVNALRSLGIVDLSVGWEVKIREALMKSALPPSASQFESMSTTASTSCDQYRN